MKFGIDPAASEFFECGRYNLSFKAEGGKQQQQKLSTNELCGLYNNLLRDYPIVLLEDPFAQDDWNSWRDFNKTCSIELVGDDLLATNIGRLSMAREHGACNSLLLKINQIGTISQAIAAYETSFPFLILFKSPHLVPD